MAEERNLWQEDETPRDLRFYFVMARRPLLISLGLILFFYLINLVSFLDWSETILNYCSWVVAVVLLLIVCWKVAKVKSQELSHAAITGFLVGVVVGVWHIILQAIWFWSWWLVVDFIIEPLVLALGGSLVGFVIAKIFQIKNKPEVKREEAPVSPVVEESSPLISDEEK
jgi:Na+/proline symporter